MSSIKRLLLFAGPCYYPDGGALDYKASADNNFELKEIYKNIYESDGYGWGMIVRASDMQILEVIGDSIAFEWKWTNEWIPYPSKNQ